MSAKDEAIKAIDHAGSLLSGEPGPLTLKLAMATLVYARENVEAIVENKRPRKPKAATA